MTNATHPFDALMDITARPEVVFVRGAGDGQHIVQRHGDVGDHDLDQGGAEGLALQAQLFGRGAAAVFNGHGPFDLGLGFGLIGGGVAGGLARAQGPRGAWHHVPRWRRRCAARVLGRATVLVCARDTTAYRGRV